MRLVFFLLLSCFFIAVHGQSDSIILLNGKVYRGDITSYENGILKYQGLDKKNQPIPMELTADRLFSFTDDGKETVVYLQNEFAGDFLTVQEAKNSTLGSYDARHTFKPRIAFITSLLCGYGISLLDTYYTQQSYDDFYAANQTPPSKVVGFFGSKPSLLPIVSPIVLSAVWGLPSFRLKEHQILQKNLFGDASYYRGYHRVAKQKRVLASLLGSAIGIGTGMLSYYVFNPY